MDRLIQNYLQERIGVKVDFDIEDASETLERLGLWIDPEALTTLSVEESIKELDAHWVELRSENYHAKLLGIAE